MVTSRLSLAAGAHARLGARVGVVKAKVSTQLTSAASELPSLSILTIYRGSHSRLDLFIYMIRFSESLGMYGAVYGQFSGPDLLCGAVFPLSLPLPCEDECGDGKLAVRGGYG